MTPEDLDDVDACVFDCDGTLIDTMGLFYAADVKACEEVGVTMSKEVFYALAGVPIRDIFARLCREQGVEMTEEGLDAMVDSCGTHARARNASSDRVRGGDRERGEEARESRRRGELGREDDGGATPARTRITRARG